MVVFLPVVVIARIASSPEPEVVAAAPITAGHFEDDDDSEEPSDDGSSPPISAVWLPFGLLDRMRLTPFTMSATTELGSSNSFSTASLTLHAQMSTTCTCNIGVYGTLPTTIQLTDESSGFAAAGGPVKNDEAARAVFGTLDVGLFGGTKGARRRTTIYRIGALLPTGSRDRHNWLPSARAGDRVLELPRSAGVRLSTSTLFGWRTLPRMCHDFFAAWRVDAGVDVAAVLVERGVPVHVIPRAGLGAMFAYGAGTYSVDSVLSLDPFVDHNAGVRWSTGITGRLARADGTGSHIHPAITLAAIHTQEGWGGSVMIDFEAGVAAAGNGD